VFRFYRLSSSLVDLTLTVNGPVPTAIRGGFRDDFRTCLIAQGSGFPLFGHIETEVSV